MIRTNDPYPGRLTNMFESLADQIKHDDQEQHSTKERVLEFSAIAVLSVLAFGGLYIGLHLLH